jgi:hypothetical protein
LDDVLVWAPVDTFARQSPRSEKINAALFRSAPIDARAGAGAKCL